MVAARVSKTMVSIDIDIPTPESGEIVQALAKQLVAYTLRNLVRTASYDIQYTNSRSRNAILQSQMTPNMKKKSFTTQISFFISLVMMISLAMMQRMNQHRTMTILLVVLASPKP